MSKLAVCEVKFKDVDEGSDATCPVI
jgi:hypothetical protein